MVGIDPSTGNVYAKDASQGNIYIYDQNNTYIDPVIQNIQNSIIAAFTTGTTRASVAKTMLAPVTNLFRTTNDPNALLALQTLSHASVDQVTSTLTQLSGQQKTVIPAVIDASLGSLHQTLASHLTPDPQVANTPLEGAHPTFVSAKLMALTKATVTDTLQEKERFFLNNSALNRGAQEKGASASSPLNRRARLDDKTSVWLQATGHTCDQPKRYFNCRPPPHQTIQEHLFS